VLATRERAMNTPSPSELDVSDERFDFDAFARALSCFPTVTSIQAYSFGTHAGERCLDAWDEAHEGPRPEYYAMQEDGLILQVMNGQMGIDVWGDDDEHSTRTHGFPLPQTFDEAFNRLLQSDEKWWEGSDGEELRGEFRLECLKGVLRWMKILAHIHEALQVHRECYRTVQYEIEAHSRGMRQDPAVGIPVCVHRQRSVILSDDR